MSGRHFSLVFVRQSTVAQFLSEVALVVNDGAAGIAPHTLWSGLLGFLLTNVGLCMLFGMLPCFLGPPPIWDSGWVGVFPASVTAEDVCQWPYSVGVSAQACSLS